MIVCARCVRREVLVKGAKMTRLAPWGVTGKVINVDATAYLHLVRGPYRFDVNAEVFCSVGNSGLVWERGKIVQKHYEEPQGVFNPYQVCEMACGDAALQQQKQKS